MHQGTLALGYHFLRSQKNTLFYVLFLSRMNLFLPLVVQKTLRNINIMLSYNNNFYIIYICVRIHVQNHTHTHTFTLYTKLLFNNHLKKMHHFFAKFVLQEDGSSAVYMVIGMHILFSCLDFFL